MEVSTIFFVSVIAFIVFLAITFANLLTAMKDGVSLDNIIKFHIALILCLIVCKLTAIISGIIWLAQYIKS